MASTAPARAGSGRARKGTPLLAMDGMVQGLVFENGRADFRNRWVRTPKYSWKTNTAVACSTTPTVDSATTETTAWRGGAHVGERPHSPRHCQHQIFPLRRRSGGVRRTWLSSAAHRPDHPGDQGRRAVGAGTCPKAPHETVASGTGLLRSPEVGRGTGVLYGWSYSDTAPYVSMKYVHPDGTVESRDLWDAPYNTREHMTFGSLPSGWSCRFSPSSST